jgi:hypothetical protein
MIERMCLTAPAKLQSISRGALLVAAAGISACVSPELEQGQAELAAGLREARASCETAMAEQRELLSQQSSRIEQQQQQLEQLSETLDKLELPPPPPPAVDCPAVASADESAPGKLVVGRRETVWLEELGLALPARIDTGAETASVDARDIELFERDGDDWVRFGIVHPDNGEVVVLERRLERRARIIQANTEEAERRPVVVLGIVIGNVRQNAEFTLSNRSHLDYQVLVGRNILSDVMVVDVSRVNSAPPDLPGFAE